MIRTCLLVGAGFSAFALSGCGTVSAANGLAKQTGRAALRAAGVEATAPDTEEETKTADAKDSAHWSEDWVWEGEEAPN